MEVAGVCPAGTTHLWEFCDQVPVDRSDSLDHVIHLALNAGRLVHLGPHRFGDGITQNANRPILLDPEPLGNDFSIGEPKADPASQRFFQIGLWGNPRNGLLEDPRA